MSSSKGKYRALLGVLVVFIVPFVVVSTVYLSKKPKTVTLDSLYDGQPFLSQPIKTKTGTEINFSDFDQDIKILYLSNEDNLAEKKGLLNDVYEKTLTYPKRDFKDPFPNILFVSFDSLYELGAEHFYQASHQSLKDSIIYNQLKEQKVLLLGRENRIRGEYDFTKESFSQLKTDLQNLMAETYFVNKKTERENRLKKKL